MAKIITYSDTRENYISLCRRHINRHKRAGTWPRSSQGEELCSVSAGLHEGECNECREEESE